MSRGRALHVGEALYRDMGAGARRDFTCLGTFQNLAARLEKRAPVSDELWSLSANLLLRDELAPRARSHEVAIPVFHSALCRRADCPRKAVEIRLTTTATPEKLPAIREVKPRAGGAASIASGRWPLAPRSPTPAEYDC